MVPVPTIKIAKAHAPFGRPTAHFRQFKPVTKAHNLVTKTRKPITKARKPITKARKPITKARKPITKSTRKQIVKPQKHPKQTHPRSKVFRKIKVVYTSRGKNGLCKPPVKKYKPMQIDTRCKFYEMSKLQLTNNIRNVNIKVRS